MNSLPDTIEQRKENMQTSTNKTSRKEPSFDREEATACHILCIGFGAIGSAIYCAIDSGGEGFLDCLSGGLGGLIAGALLGAFIGYILGSFYGWISERYAYGIFIGGIIGGVLGFFIETSDGTSFSNIIDDIIGFGIIGGIIGGSIHATSRWYIKTSNKTKPSVADGNAMTEQTKEPSFDREAATACFRLCTILVTIGFCCAIDRGGEGFRYGIWSGLGTLIAGGILGSLLGCILGSFYGWISERYACGIFIGGIIGGVLAFFIEKSDGTAFSNIIDEIIYFGIIGSIIGGGIHAGRRWYIELDDGTEPSAKENETPSEEPAASQEANKQAPMK